MKENLYHKWVKCIKHCKLYKLHFVSKLLLEFVQSSQLLKIIRNITGLELISLHPGSGLLVAAKCPSIFTITNCELNLKNKLADVY